VRDRGWWQGRGRRAGQSGLAAVTLLIVRRIGWDRRGMGEEIERVIVDATGRTRGHADRARHQRNQGHRTEKHQEPGGMRFQPAGSLVVAPQSTGHSCARHSVVVSTRLYVARGILQLPASLPSAGRSSARSTARKVARARRWRAFTSWRERPSSEATSRVRRSRKYRPAITAR